MPSRTSASRPLPGSSGARVPYPQAATTLDLIEEQARLRPDAVALVYDGASLTYRELDGRANSLAARLVEHGARRRTLLPLLVSDGMELPLSMVAAMKAGIPFIPFDPGWPGERISALLGDLGTDLAVGSTRTPEAARGIARTLVVDHRTLPHSPAAPAAGRPVRPDLVYGFFTSGTTGLPKCTLNVHHGLLNRFLFMTRKFGPGHVSLQNSRSVFDSSLWQLLWPLTMGGSVVMPRRDGLLDLERTALQIGRHGVTITDFVPSIFTVLVDLLACEPRLADAVGSLRHVLVGGEAINVDAVRRFQELLPQVAVTNTYGPTEASIGSVFHTVPQGGTPPASAGGTPTHAADAVGESGTEIPLGRPIDNTSAVVVDEALRRLCTGETGEVLIGGDCLGLGYLGDARRTATAFVPNPFPDIPGDRLYRTGDLGQYRADGCLYFVGRRDDQVKVRGVRIEPAEVERALLALPGVQDVKVVVLGAADRMMLVAAVVAEDGFDPADARARARRLLPAEQVPDRFSRIAGMPLSPNGKADRRALVRLLEAAAAGGGSAGAPGGGSGGDPGGVRTAVTGPDGTGRDATRRDQTGPDGTRHDGTGHDATELEAAVRTVWADLLGTGRELRPEVTLFDAGGTSLTAQSLALRLREMSGLQVSVRDVMAAQTIRDQVRLIAQGGPVRDDSAVRQEMLADAVLPWATGNHAPPAPARMPANGARPARTPGGAPSGSVVPQAAPRRIFLTGGTGFIGIHLLCELLRSTDAVVHCLVNADDDKAARARLDDRARYYTLPLDSGHDRVRVVRGTLAAERFGMSESAFRALADDVDTIVHAGAEVNLVYPYRRLRAVNVLGTREVIRLARAGAGPARPVHHLSTLGILPHDGPAPYESTFPPVEGVPPDGYGQTKWVAEAVLLKARREHGLPVSLYRMGEVMPHTGTGVFSHGGSLAEFLLDACVELGVVFSTGAQSDFTPVDNVSRFIAAAVRDRCLGETFHVVQRDPVRLDDLLGCFRAGFGLGTVEYTEFRSRVAGHDSALMRRLNAILPEPGVDGTPALRAAFRDIPSPDFSRNCHELVQAIGVEWLPVGADVFARYAAFRGGSAPR